MDRRGGRFYGWLLTISAGRTPAIADLCWLRVTGALGLGLVAAGLFFVLRRQRWPDGWAALTAALLVLLPSGQLIAGGASAGRTWWPRVWVWRPLPPRSAVSSRAAPGCGQPGSRWRWLGVLSGALVYQCGVMFYLAGVAGGLGRRLAGSWRKPLGGWSATAACWGRGCCSRSM